MNNYSTIEYFKTHTEQSLTSTQKKTTQPVDYCTLRPLNDIKSNMCDDTPPPTSRCIKPAITHPLTTKKCALYRYEAPHIIYQKLETNGFYIFRNMVESSDIRDINLDTDKMDDIHTEVVETKILKNINIELQNTFVNFQFGIGTHSSVRNIRKFQRDIQNYSKKIPEIYSLLMFVGGGDITMIPGSHRFPNMSLNNLYHFWNNQQRFKINQGDIVMMNASLIYSFIQPSSYLHVSPVVPSDKINYFKKSILFSNYITGLDDKRTDSVWYPVIKNTNNKYINKINSVLDYINVSLGYSKIGIQLFTDDTNIHFITNPQQYKSFQIDLDGLNIVEPQYRKQLAFLTNIINYIILYILIVITIIILVLILKMLYYHSYY